MIYGYIRVSTKEQNIERQLNALHKINISNQDTPLYNFINDTLVSESTVLRHLLRHLILYQFRLFP